MQARAGRRQAHEQPRRGPVDHVVIFDGTLSTLKPGCETNAGLTYRLLREAAPAANLSILYEAGLQWDNWGQTWRVATGVGINRQIRRAYGFIASRYRPGDRIFLFGYSRGAFAVRSLAGMIDKIGLVRKDQANTRNIRQAFRHYQCSGDSDASRAFSRTFCHASTQIEMVGVWDTVKALGLHWPLIWRLFVARHKFHTPHLGRTIRHGYHAIALDETRAAFTPVLWRTDAERKAVVEQVWFRGAHGDIGGHLGGYEVARPLSNIPFVWMLDKADTHALALPQGWRSRFPCDANVPSVGTFRGWGKMFLLRQKRLVGRDASERIFGDLPKG